MYIVNQTMIKTLYKKLVPYRYRIAAIVAAKKLYGYWLYGHQVYCVCCGRSFRRFLAKGNGLEIRRNAECPSCGSLERGRLLYSYLREETDIFAGKPSILHISPERCLKRLLIENPNYIDVDIDPLMARYVVDITAIPYVDQTFDYIICAHVLGHIKDEKRAIEELYRVLKIQGVAFILTLIDITAEQTREDSLVKTSGQRLQQYGEVDLERLHGLDFLERLQRADIMVEEIDYRDRFSMMDRKRLAFGDGRREFIYKCTRLA